MVYLRYFVKNMAVTKVCGEICSETLFGLLKEMLYRYLAEDSPAEDSPRDEGVFIQWTTSLLCADLYTHEWFPTQSDLLHMENCRPTNFKNGIIDVAQFDDKD